MLPSLAAALIAGSPDAVLVIDAVGHYQDGNPAACHLLGYTREEVLRLHVHDLVPQDASWLEEAWATYRTEGYWRGEIELRRKDGRRVSLDAWSVVIPGPEGTVYASFLRDLAAKRTAEEDLAATHQHRRDVLDRITDNFYALDDHWRFTYINDNDAIERHFGYSRKEVLGHNLWERFPQSTQMPLADALRQAFSDREPRSAEFFSPKTEQTYETRIYPSACGLSVFFRNVTEQRQQQQAMQEALAAAEAGLRAKTSFLATMSHELHTPLQTVVGYADLLLGGSPGRLNRRQAEDIQAIRAAASRMTVLIDALLALSRAEGKRITATVAPDELRRVIHQVRQEAGPRASEKQLALHVDLPPRLPGVHGDLGCLHRILLNLVWNAVKFTGAGEVTISAEVTDVEVAITVRDTGIGIAAEALPQIFADFNQVDSGMTRRYEGAGLGLAIAKRLAEQMGGRISVTSRMGEGSAFTLHLAIGSPDSKP